MTTPLISYLILLAVLLVISGFFASAETIFFSLDRSELARFKSSKDPWHKNLVKLLAKPKDFLVTILFGNELTNIAISVIIAGLFYRFLGDILEIKILTFLSVAIGTFLILIIGEIIPKSIGVYYAPSMAPMTAFLLKPLYTLLKPFRFLLVKLANGVIHLFGGEKVQKSPLIVEEEFRALLDLGEKSGEVDPEEKELIHKAFEFRTKIVSQIMTPMNLVFSLPIDIEHDDLIEQVKATQFSRIPVYENNPNNIIGLLYVKELFQFDRKRKGGQSMNLREILRPPFFTSPNESLEALLQQIRQTRIHMAVVANENKKPVGIVTLHDIVEELFGEVEE